ncbi:helix-turn-helix domain-containing protein [Streptomyces sp. NPDC005899]|uniref:helix-turn-helix domain-containing protein n=1 Tax=Streptomyces sp. NPDC005899 TaxID=3155716 RepID=UPI0033D77C6B
MGTEIQDFAALLRGLKERSGLSYGALAQKLHMSTSTVHRYCNGDAVPHDYAPVERFARVCRASADELVALHRKWILADEAKRRRVPGPAVGIPAKTEADANADADTQAEAGAGAGAEAEAAEPEAVKPEAAGARAPQPRPQQPQPQPQRPRSQAEQEAAAGPGGTPTAESARRAATGPGPEAEGELTREPAPGHAPGTVRGPARRRRSLGIALAAAAVVALAVPTTVVLGNLSSPQGGDSVTAGKGEAAVASGRPRSPSAEARPSAGATAGKGSASPSPTSAEASPSARPSPQATPGAPGGAPARTGVPLSVHIRPDTWESKCEQTYMLDREPERVPPPPYESDAGTWARSIEAVPGGMKRIELVAQGKEAGAVVLEAVHVRVVGRSPAPPWQAYAMPQGCGSGVLVATYEVDLDAARPLFRAVPTDNGERTLPAAPLPLKTSVHDPVVLVVYARTRTYDARWYLELDWSSGDRHGTMRIDDDGQPFRTMAMDSRPLYDYWPEKKTWVRRDY